MRCCGYAFACEYRAGASRTSIRGGDGHDLPHPPRHDVHDLSTVQPAGTRGYISSNQGHTASVTSILTESGQHSRMQLSEGLHFLQEEGEEEEEEEEEGEKERAGDMDT